MVKYDKRKLHPRDQFKMDTYDMWKSDKDLKFEKFSGNDLWKYEKQNVFEKNVF